MKCFVHLDRDPLPKSVINPEIAIALAESLLKTEDENKWQIQWRRDELYPDNFSVYSKNDLQNQLLSVGSIVLQQIKIGPDNVHLMGESASIFTADLERKLTKQAETAIIEMDKKIDVHGESFLAVRGRNKIKKNKSI